jgi:hypothetical protein
MPTVNIADKKAGEKSMNESKLEPAKYPPAPLLAAPAGDARKRAKIWAAQKTGAARLSD